VFAHRREPLGLDARPRGPLRRIIFIRTVDIVAVTYANRIGSTERSARLKEALD